MSLIKIDKKIDVSSAKISFKTKTKKNAKVKKRVELKKLDLNVIVKKFVGSVPIQAKITDVNKQSIESRAASVVRGATPSVAAPLMKKATDSDAMKLEVKDWNDILYHDISGAYTNPASNKYDISGLPKSEIRSPKDGWMKYSTGWKYRLNGQYVIGWKYIDGQWYYFHMDEYMCTGWRMINDNRYYFKTEADAIKAGDRNAYGYMWTGWRKINNDWYYFKTKEDASKGKDKNAYGYMWHGWRYIDNKWYYMKYDGKLVETFKINEESYYGYRSSMIIAEVENDNILVDKVLRDIEQEATDKPHLYGNTDFIKDQGEFDSTLSTFGFKGNLVNHGCGAIAMYNVMHSMGDNITFKRIVTDMIKESGENVYTYMIEESGEKLYAHTGTETYPVNFHGTLGTNPFYINKYMERCGYKVRCRDAVDVLLENYNINSHDAYIALYFWYLYENGEEDNSTDDKISFMLGGHYEALIPNDDGVLKGYNATIDYMDLTDYIYKKIDDEGGVAFIMYIYEIDR